MYILNTIHTTTHIERYKFSFYVGKELHEVVNNRSRGIAKDRSGYRIQPSFTKKQHPENTGNHKECPRTAA